MIEIKDLKFKYDGSKVNALDGVNLSIPKGKYIAILGHNGSGKSTLSKLLVGLYKPTEGEIIIDGIKMRLNSIKDIRKKIGIIFQNPDNQFIGSSVEDDIAFGLENNCVPREEMKERIIEFATKVGMINFLEREPHTLSGGQKQKVAIASVLALSPEIVIFDEVTSMLDPKGKTEILKLIKDIQITGEKTLISITHDMDEAVQADYLLVFAQGKLVAEGSPKDILKNEEIIAIAKIDSPFIYKLSLKINGIDPTYDAEELIGEIWK